MNKLKSIFGKDKDRDESSHSSYNTSSGNTQPYSTPQSDTYATPSSGNQSYETPSSTTQSYGASSGGSQFDDTPSGGEQSYGAPASGAQSRSKPSASVADSTSSSSFPPNTAPSSGIEYAQNSQGVVLHTTLGDITIALFSQDTPRTCQNFATLAASGKYDNVVFHRIIPGFMIQGGDPDGTGRGGKSIYGGKFKDEFVPELRHTRKGILSMANSGPNTNGSQFFITLAATPHLDDKHTVFGEVAAGMDVVDRLGAVRTDSSDRPLEEVSIMRCDVF
ncbi:hypothetical protein PV11_06174 [Exophiala sideris]|uniref:Peptidyl-prolyl cis-trans isomerase n=1 Tax=Exophiala sideris TaxID=1016849 RepID=A0A0D1YMR6_9EURO|nr:hypothetical protein PV11_06174 [Exophiala sideris]